jgi:hypothetical protein
MYTYPPFRAAVPIFFLGVLIYQKWSAKKVVCFLTVAVLLSIPLIQQTLSGGIQGRFNRLSVFGDYPSNPVADQSIFLKSIFFLKNIFLHLNPEYLFISGDDNLRHAPLFSGQLSYFSAFIVILFVVGYFIHNRDNAEYSYLSEEGRGFLRLSLWGIFCCTIPAALTWQGIPHALRSIGAWPFFVLLFAFMLTRVLNWAPKWVIYLPIIIQFSFFHWNYFYSFPNVAARWYDKQIVDEANKNSVAFQLAKYPEIAKFYHRVRLERLRPETIRSICAKGQ